MIMLYLRELPVSSSQSAQALVEERVDLILLHWTGQVQWGEWASVVVTPCAWEGERHHWSLLPLWQEVEQRLPHGPVLIHIHTHTLLTSYGANICAPPLWQQIQKVLDHERPLVENPICSKHKWGWGCEERERDWGSKFTSTLCFIFYSKSEYFFKCVNHFIIIMINNNKKNTDLTWCGALWHLLRTKRLGMFTGALLFGLHGCIVPKHTHTHRFLPCDNKSLSINYTTPKNMSAESCRRYLALRFYPINATVV